MSSRELYVSSIASKSSVQVRLGGRIVRDPPEPYRTIRVEDEHCPIRDTVGTGIPETG